MAQPITWKELRDAVAALHEGLLGARDQANEAVWNPPDDRRLDRIYVDAYADLRFEVDGLAHRAEVLVERMAEAAAPARPLEAVLADIEAEGHRTVAIRYSVTLGYWLCETDTGAERWVGDDVAEWEAWCTSVERGESRGGTATEAAQARLAQVRDLHAEKAANPLASLNLTPAQVRENIEEALAAPPPVAAADAVERDQARASETDGGEEGA